MKDRIINYFKTDRSHASGVSLVMELSGRMALKKQLNIHPQSEYTTGLVHEELREIAGISRDELTGIFSMPVQKVVPVEPEVLQKTDKKPAKPKETNAKKNTADADATKKGKVPVAVGIPAEKKASLKK